MIEKLTPEQEKFVGVYQKKWHNQFFNLEFNEEVINNLNIIHTKHHNWEALTDLEIGYLQALSDLKERLKL